MKFNTINRVQTIFNPDQYLADPGLVNAAEVVFALRQPLLIMGEPGTGKTRFAYKLAYDLSHQNQNSGFYFRDKPLTFFTKTNSQARDLFYTYDALSQYQEANIRRDVSGELPKTIDFIELQALGKAIAMTNPQGIQHPQLIRNFGSTPWSSVVLIDEIESSMRLP